MKVWLTPLAAEDLAYWRSENPMMQARIERILHQLEQDIPLPRYQAAPLLLAYPPLLSVKISTEQRLVFEQVHDAIVVHQCRYHY